MHSSFGHGNSSTSWLVCSMFKNWIVDRSTARDFTVPNCILLLIFQASDYGTMSQSCTSVPSAVPPLNLDNDINHMEMYDTDDPRRDVSLGYLGIGSRFSDISIGERKDRINNLISEIYCAAPLSSGNSSRKSLHQSIKRYASVDQVSDVDSVITGTTVVRCFLYLKVFRVQAAS